MEFLIRLMICVFFIFSPMIIQANCVIDNTTNPNGETLLGSSLAGQQFIACETGNISNIQVSTSGGDIDLYLVEEDGEDITYGMPYQTFTSQPAGLVTLALRTPFSVIEDELYALAIGNVTSVTFDSIPMGLPEDSSIPDGQFSFELTDSGDHIVVSASDLVFGVTIMSPPVTPITPAIPVIPSLSQWGLIILGLMMLNLGLFFICRFDLK